jgi:hypothetical protein
MNQSWLNGFLRWDEKKEKKRVPLQFPQAQAIGNEQLSRFAESNGLRCFASIRLMCSSKQGFAPLTGATNHR